MTDRVQRLLTDFEALSADEQSAFRAALASIEASAAIDWDRQFSDDVAAGRLDQLGAVAIARQHDGNTLPPPSR